MCFVIGACQPLEHPQAYPSTPTGSTPTLASTLIPATPINFPPGINPLTGKPVTDSNLLEIPAVLLSISHFPATGRPQAGLSFAPLVYEIYITEGATRFLAVFYGELPAPEFPLTGDCEVRNGVFVQSALLVGNQVWLDLNGNGIQEPGEPGVGGVCVYLYNQNGTPLQQTTTDSNGYYGFNVQPGKYTLEFIKPAWASFTHTNLGTPMEMLSRSEDVSDSDVDQTNGRVDVELNSDILTADAGLVDSAGLLLNQDPAYFPPAQVGPIRSGRLVYAYLADSYPHSCLIFAGASPEVFARLPQCYLVFHQLAGGGYMLDIDEMWTIAKKNLQEKGSDFNYAVNSFSVEPPPGGVPAGQLDVFMAYLNQSAWIYDPLYQAYLRYVDTSEYDKAGVLFPDKDRLTNRQLHFENVIVVFAQHDVISTTNLDIRLNPGRVGKALLFRDGQMFTIQWSTETRAEEDPHPIQFLDLDGHPMPLKPGHTWVLVVTKESIFKENSPGQGSLFFIPPEGAR